MSETKMPFKKLIDKLKSCFGYRTSKVSPEAMLSPIQLSSEIQYAWYGHPTATCCKQIHTACFDCHLDCLKMLIEYEHRLFSEEHIAHTKRQTCPYFSWMAPNGTIEIFNYLMSIGYHPSWSHFLSDIIRYHNITLLQDLHKAKLLPNDPKGSSWYLKHIYAHFFEQNLREGDLDDPRVTETFLYFLNYGSQEGFSLLQGSIYILDIVSRGIKEVPIEHLDNLYEAIRLILMCLAYIAPRDEDTRRIRRDSLIECYQSIFDKLVAMSVRKDLLVQVMINSDIITKDLVKYVVSPYLEPY